MRSIDADRLKEYKCSICDNRERCEDRETVCSDIAEIDEQPTIEAEPDNGWISVKERLPENDGKYMVWCDGELDICEFNVESQTFGYTYEDYDEMYSHLLGWDDTIHEDVTHWQPLPEPPKGE